MAKKATTDLELTFSPGYVPTWGVWEGVRELITNGLDAQDRGYPLSITYTPEKGPNSPSRLRVINEGVTIGRKHLVFGNSESRDDERCRGKHGEGMKLGMMVLLRAGLQVWAKSGSERWSPRLEHSDDFESILVKVACAPVKHQDITRTDVLGLTKDDWKLIKRRFVALKKPAKSKRISVGYDHILTGKEYRNQLYVQGVWVCQLPDNYKWGYDLHGVELHRDRAVPDPWSLKYSIRNVLKAAVARGLVPAKKLYKLLKEDHYAEAASFRDYRAYGSKAFEEEITTLFLAEHGEEAHPVASMEESMQAEHFGIKGVVVPTAIRDVVTMIQGTFEDKKKAKGKEINTSLSASDLTSDEIETFVWLLDTFRRCDEDLPADVVNVVEFHDPQVRGSFQGGKINLSRTVLSDRLQAIKTLAHEVSHRYGEDVEFHDKMVDLLAQIIISLATN